MSAAEVYLPLDPAYARDSAMAEFARRCSERAGADLSDFLRLHDWALTHQADFWHVFIDWSGLEISGDTEPAVSSKDCEHARFFPNARLNYSRNLLRSRAPGWAGRAALLAFTEDGQRTEMSRQALLDAVERLAGRLRRHGVAEGDRVVAIVRNSADAVVCCLATAALGAVWSSVPPDLGEEAISDRFVQLTPKVLIAHTAFTTHGTRREIGERIAALSVNLTTLQTVMVLDGGMLPPLRAGIELDLLEDRARDAPLSMSEWPSVAFNDPLFVLFSSGTTGAPKCLMHGAGGTLLEHYKELALHTNLSADDKLFFQTSTGWMMFNWQLSALACGTQIVLFDGSPTFPDAAALLSAVDREQITVFGTNATYLHALEQLGIVPREIAPFRALRAILSTGSILYDAQFDWIKAAFKHLPIHSISGGTDMIGCFVLGNPLLPVYRGQSQSVSLGLDVRVMTDAGLARHGVGELVCALPFPSRPVGIYGDSDGRRFHEAYFSQNAGVWTHGDTVELSPGGSARIMGRSDGTLKIRGVRIGPAEIYAIVSLIPGIAQSLAVEQRAPREPGGSRLVLLVVLAAGKSLDRPLTLLLKRELSQRASPNHVPSIIAQVSAIPTTHSGKYSERAARDVLNRKPIVNRSALKNPQVLDEIAGIPELQLQESPPTG